MNWSNGQAIGQDPAMPPDDSVLSLFLTFEQRDIVPASVLATLAQSMPQILNDFATEYAGLKPIEWGFTHLAVGSLNTVFAPLAEVPVTDIPKLRLVTGALREASAAVQSGSDVVDAFPEKSVGPFEKILRLLDHQVTSISVSGNDTAPIVLTREGAGSRDHKKIRRRSLGSIRGIVQGVSFATSTPHFTIRRNGKGRLIKCFFNDDDELSRNVIGSLRMMVTAEGVLVRDDFGVLQRLEVTRALTRRDHGETSRTSGKISAMDLLGIAPNLTEGLPSDEWLRRQRSE